MSCVFRFAHNRRRSFLRFRILVALGVVFGVTAACTFDRSGLYSKLPEDEASQGDPLDVAVDFGLVPDTGDDREPPSDIALDDVSPQLDGLGDTPLNPEVTTDVLADTPLELDAPVDTAADVVSEPETGDDAAPDLDADGDDTAAFVCGDGIRTGDEACEGEDLNGADCTTLFFDLGTLSCTEGCSFNTTGCVIAPPDWYDIGWLYRKSLRIDAPEVVQDEDDFPVLVNTTDADLAARALESGGDLIFTAADGITPIPFEIERWRSSDGNLVAWVRVAELSSTEDTRLYLYYGNSEPGLLPALESVWDGDYAAVWHLNESTLNHETSGSHTDSTGNGHTGTQGGNAMGSGQIGAGQLFDGNDFVTVWASDTIQLGDTSVTISAWMRTVASAAMGIVVKSPPDSHEANDKLFGVNHDTHVLGIDQGWVHYLGGATTITDGEWHHVVWVQEQNVTGSNERWQLFVDGGFESERLAQTSPDPSGHVLRIGDGVPTSYFASPFFGALDEVRISTTARSSGWLATSHANQSAPSSFISYGLEQSLLP